MSISKPVSSLTPNAVIGQYRSILHTMINDLVPAWYGRYNNKKNKSNNKTLARFLREFGDFSWAYFESVVEAMPPSVRSNPIQIQRDLRRVIDNLQRNWGEVMAVCNQRENKNIRDLLVDADRRADDYYGRYCGFKATVDTTEGKEEVKPITYFGSRYEITRYPYTPFPLLSIRYEAIGDKVLRNNGLAHELGHFIYWNMLSASRSPDFIRAHKELGNRIEQSLLVKQWNLPNEQAKNASEELVADWRNWKAEVFADIVGVLLVGRQYAETSSRIYVEELANEQRALYPNDAFHPIPILRPLIALEALDLISESADTFRKQRSEHNELRHRWQEAAALAIQDWALPGEGFEATKREFEEHRQKALVAVQQARYIVELFLNEPIWPQMEENNNIVYRRLLDLFKLREPGDDAYEPPVQETVESVQKSPYFQEVVEAVQLVTNIRLLQGNSATNTRSKNEELEIFYRALLNLSLSEEQGSLGCTRVVEAAPGQKGADYTTRPDANCSWQYEVLFAGYRQGTHKLPN